MAGTDCGIDSAGESSIWQGHSLIEGQAAGKVLFSDVGLSFWGGVDPLTGMVIDHHHPLFGQCISGTMLAIPSGRGSCTGSCVMLELILNKVAPAALIFEQDETILPLGVIIAQEIYGQSLPVLHLAKERFAALADAQQASLSDGRLTTHQADQTTSETLIATVPPMAVNPIALSDHDIAMLRGDHGEGAKLAMGIVTRMAGLMGAEQLIDVTKAHIDGCIYIGPGGLDFAQRLCAMGAKVAVPTTLNAISIDWRHWRAQGIPSELGEPSERLAAAYTGMGAAASFTCAPYLLQNPPVYGEAIVWAESNAVVYANSVIGARTLKYPDYLDICVAITGRAPLTGCYRDEERKPELAIDVASLKGIDESFYPLLGHHIGMMAPTAIPLITGLEHLTPDKDDLKAFGAAFATTSAAPMFHILGITPEAGQYRDHGMQLPQLTVSAEDLCRSWHELNSAQSARIDLIAIGNPHASCEELGTIAQLSALHGGSCSIPVVITCGRGEYRKAHEAGYIGTLERFGAQFVNDTCWCMLTEPVIPPTARVIMTNSGKYAHYAPGLVGRSMRFGSLEDCIKAASGMQLEPSPPRWLLS
jgi:predicted aconitase/predicted aconitase with swiveling domain